MGEITAVERAYFICRGGLQAIEKGEDLTREEMQAIARAALDQVKSCPICAQPSTQYFGFCSARCQGIHRTWSDGIAKLNLTDLSQSHEAG